MRQRETSGGTHIQRGHTFREADKGASQQTHSHSRLYAAARCSCTGLRGQQAEARLPWSSTDLVECRLQRVSSSHPNLVFVAGSANRVSVSTSSGATRHHWATHAMPTDTDRRGGRRTDGAGRELLTTLQRWSDSDTESPRLVSAAVTSRDRRHPSTRMHATDEIERWWTGARLDWGEHRGNARNEPNDSRTSRRRRHQRQTEERATKKAGQTIDEAINERRANRRLLKSRRCCLVRV